MTITGANEGPTVSVTDIVTTDDHSTVGGIHAQASDVDVGDTATYHLLGGVADGAGHETLNTDFGTVRINTANGEYSFTPHDSALGATEVQADSFQVIATDSHGASSAPSTVNVTIRGSDDGPVLSVSDNQGHGAISGSVSATDVDAHDTLSYSLVGAGSDGQLHLPHGDVSIDASGNYTFTPVQGWQGGDQTTFSVQVSDGHGGSAVKAITLTETDQGPAFGAPQQTFSGVEGTSGAATTVTGTISASDGDHDSLTYSRVADNQTHHGNLEVGADGKVSYTATDANWSGDDSFTVQASDGHGGVATETVKIHVDGAPDVATGVSVQIGAGTVSPGGSFTVKNLDGEAGYSNTYGYYVTDASGNPTSGHVIWANTHADVGQTATITGVDPDHVGFFIIPNGHGYNPGLTDNTDITFAHDSSGWHAVANGVTLGGADTGVLFDKGTLNADNLTHVRDSSVDAGNQNWEDLKGGGDRDFNDTNVTVTWAAATPTESHPLTVTATFPDSDGSEAHAVKLSGLPGGASLYQDGKLLTPAADGSYTLADPSHLTGLSIQTPVGFVGDVGVKVTAFSSENGVTVSAEATAATVHDDLANHGPSASANVGYSDAVNTALTGTIAATDADTGNHLSYSLSTTDGAAHGSVVLGIDGSFTYTPTSGWSGADHFSVVIADGHGGSTTETVAVTVAAPNHAPVIDAAHTTATLTLSDSESANIGQVKATDADGDTLAYSVQSDTLSHHGNLVVDSASGSFFYDSTDTGWKGTDHFTVQVSDGHGGTTTQAVNVNVSGSGNDVGYVKSGGSGGGSGGGSAGPVGWGDGGGRSESWGADGSWTVGGQNAGGSGGGHDTHVVTSSVDSHWGSSWYALDSGNPGQAGTGDMVSIAGYNQHNHVISGGNSDTLVGSSGNDYISLDDGKGDQMIKGISHIQLGDGANAILDMTTPNMDYGNMTVAGGSGHDVIWTAGGDDLITAGNGTTTVHAGAGNDTIVAGAGDDTLLGQNGSDTFMFDFGHGHATVDGGAGGNWTDVLDLSTDMHAGATITITTADNHSWTVASDGDHQAHATIQLGQDKGGEVTVHSNQGDEHITFTNIEQIKF